MIPDLVPLIEPLKERFPKAWQKCLAPHDDGEFNARVASVLYYEEGLLAAGRNGKRGDPQNLSKDIINWRGEGPNPDPVNGWFGTIIDFIAAHESPDADITQLYPDPNGPGAWVKPKTLAQIDEDYGSSAPISQPYPDERTWWPQVFDVEVAKRYQRAGKVYPDGPSAFRWASRTAYDIAAGMTKEDSLAKHLKELEQELGLP